MLTQTRSRFCKPNILNRRSHGAASCIASAAHWNWRSRRSTSGFYISFSGNITFKKAEDLRATAAQIPLERLLIETDCPYLTPVPFRGKRNEPARVVEVARCLAEIHGLGLEDVGRITTANFADNLPSARDIAPNFTCLRFDAILASTRTTSLA